MANDVQPTTPGFGVAGMMLCPYLKSPCVKSACELWVELTYARGAPDERVVGRCAVAWTPIITSEQTQELVRLRTHLQEAVHAPAT